MLFYPIKMNFLGTFQTQEIVFIYLLFKSYKFSTFVCYFSIELSEENADKISTPSTLSLNRFLEEKHEYFLHKFV